MRIPPMYVIKRLGFLVAVMWTAATLNFLLPHLSPKDPVAEQVTQKIASGGLTAEAAQQMMVGLRTLYGLDQPLWRQYLKYIWNTFRFDLGNSIYSWPRPVMDIINQTIWWTLGFAGMATASCLPPRYGAGSVGGVVQGAAVLWLADSTAGRVLCDTGLRVGAPLDLLRRLQGAAMVERDPLLPAPRWLFG